MLHCRVEDQPKPTGDGQVVFPTLLQRFMNKVPVVLQPRNEQVVVDIVERAMLGKERYGFFLKAHNGRDAAVDAYQELLDAAMYIAQMELEGQETYAFLDQIINMISIFRFKCL